MADLIERQAAIDEAYGYRVDNIQNDYDKGYERAVEDICKSLSVLPSAQPEKRTDERTETHGVCLDAISRQVVIDAVQGIGRIATLPDNDAVIRMSAVEYVLFNLPSAQPEQQWIPCSKPPKESGTYIVTAYDGTDKRVTFVKYQKTLKRWDLTGARAYWRILAYKPLPEPWKGEEHETTL